MECIKMPSVGKTFLNRRNVGILRSTITFLVRMLWMFKWCVQFSSTITRPSNETFNHFSDKMNESVGQVMCSSLKNILLSIYSFGENPKVFFIEHKFPKPTIAHNQNNKQKKKRTLIFFSVKCSITLHDIIICFQVFKILLRE